MKRQKFRMKLNSMAQFSLAEHVQARGNLTTFENCLLTVMWFIKVVYHLREETGLGPQFG